MIAYVNGYVCTTSCEAAVFLVIRGEAATAWKGFHRGGAPTPELNVPLDQAGLVPRAIASNATEIAAASELGPIDQKLLVSLGQTDGDLAVVPVAIGGQVMCAIAMVTATDAAIKTAESIAAATGAAFSRMLRRAYPERVTRENQTALTMTVFGMINWTFTWLKPGGKLSYAAFADMVVDLLEGGLPGKAAAPAEALARR